MALSSLAIESLGDALADAMEASAASPPAPETDHPELSMAARCCGSPPAHSAVALNEDMSSCKRGRSPDGVTTPPRGVEVSHTNALDATCSTHAEILCASTIDMPVAAHPPARPPNPMPNPSNHYAAMGAEQHQPTPYTATPAAPTAVVQEPYLGTMLNAPYSLAPAQPQPQHVVMPQPAAQYYLVPSYQPVQQHAATPTPYQPTYHALTPSLPAPQQGYAAAPYDPYALNQPTAVPVTLSYQVALPYSPHGQPAAPPPLQHAMAPTPVQFQMPVQIQTPVHVPVQIQTPVQVLVQTPVQVPVPVQTPVQVPVPQTPVQVPVPQTPVQVTVPVQTPLQVLAQNYVPVQGPV